MDFETLRSWQEKRGSRDYWEGATDSAVICIAAVVFLAFLIR